MKIVLLILETDLMFFLKTDGPDAALADIDDELSGGTGRFQMA